MESVKPRAVYCCQIDRCIKIKKLTLEHSAEKLFGGCRRLLVVIVANGGGGRRARHADDGVGPATLAADSEAADCRPNKVTIDIEFLGQPLHICYLLSFCLIQNS